jgi:hypothetical protein
MNSAPSGKLIMTTFKESMLNEETRRKERVVCLVLPLSQKLLLQSHRGEAKLEKNLCAAIITRRGIRKRIAIYLRGINQEKETKIEKNYKDTKGVARDSDCDD